MNFLINKIVKFLEKKNFFFRLSGFLQRELSCFFLKNGYKISPFIPKYLVKLLPFVSADKDLLKHLESAICLSKFSVSSYKILSPFDSLCASNPSCFEVNKTIYVLYTIHNHKTTASRRFHYTNKSGSSKVGFGLSIITSEGVQKNLGAANLDSSITICDFRCISLETSALVSCSFESDGDGVHRIGWCLVPFDELDQGPSKWIFCLENSPFDNKTEKNWIPIHVEKNNFKFIYRLEGEIKTSETFLKVKNKNQLLVFPYSKTFSKKRGGSPFLKLENFFLALAHQTYSKPYRNYLHFFALGKWKQNDKFEIQIFNNSFFFFEPFDTEYCCGVCEIDNYVVFSFGFRNSEAWLMKFKKKKLIEMLDINIKR